MIRRFITYYRPYRGLFVLDMSTAVLHSSFTLAIPYFVRNMLKYDLPAGDLRGMVVHLSIILLLIVLTCVTRYINTRWGHVLGTRMEADMRSDLFRHIQKLSHTYFDQSKTGHLISRIANDLFNVSELAHHGPEDLVISTLMIVGAVVIMLKFNLSLALLALIPLPIKHEILL